MMEYNIINEIITNSVANLFKLILFPEKQPSYSATPEDRSISTQPIKNQSKQSLSDDWVTSGNSFNSFSSLSLEKKGSTEFIKKEKNNHASSTNEDTELTSYNADILSQKHLKSNSNNSLSLESLKVQDSLDPKQNKKANVQDLSQEKPKAYTVPPTVEHWIQLLGPKKLIESLERLGLNTYSINKVDISSLTSEKLELEKKNVKNELKRYDVSFVDLFKRMPDRVEKEPIRPLYIYYKKLKQQISQVNDNSIEKSQQQSSHSISTENHKKGVSSSRNSFEMNPKNNENKIDNIWKKHDSSFEDNLISDKMKEKEKFSTSKSKETLTKVEKKLTKEEAKSKLEILDAIRTQMREKLHTYQIEFTKNNNRKIKYHKDIIPVEEEYKRYKEVKEEMSMLEEFLKS